MRILRSPLVAIGLAALAWIGKPSLQAEPPLGWPLIFSDEFDGAHLDTTKWNTTMEFAGAMGPRFHNEYYLSYTLDEEVVLTGGLLQLRTDRRTISGTEPIGLFEYSQGLVSTHDKFNFSYGYIEIRAKYPGGKGMWPCFWLMPQHQSWPPEFDIAEYYGGQRKMHFGLAHGSMHDPRWDSSGDTTTDFAGVWRTYALEWTPGRAVWSVDGVPQKTVTAEYIPATPMYIVLSNSVSSQRGPSGAPDENTVFPNQFEIDYVRVYQAPPQTLASTEPAPAPKPKPAEVAAPSIIAILPSAVLP